MNGLCKPHPIWPAACLVLTATLVLTAAQPAAQPGWVLSHQKISDTEGGLTGVLDDGDVFDSSVASLGDLGADGVDDLAVGPTDDDDSCYPDCDGNGVLNFFDFICFQDAFLDCDPYADCDGNGICDIFDFLCFQNAYLAGCP